MSFIAFSTAAPQVGEEQPLSSTAKLISSWTTLDISAAFPPTKTPYSARALIILGADFPSSGLLGKMRVRKFGDTTSYEEAPGALGITSIVHRDSGEYLSGGFLATITIPVDIDGKFEYQLQNDSAAPRTMIRILEVTTIEEIQDPIPLAQKGVANGVASLDGATLVVENPANATATPTPDKIPKADGSGKLDGWVSIPSVFEVVDAITIEASHTGDLLETTLGTLVVPADKMGANGSIRFGMVGLSPSLAHYRVYFGQINPANLIGYWRISNHHMIASWPIRVWNKNAVNAQGAMAGSTTTQLVHGYALNGTILAMTEDTTADVNIYVTVQLGNVAHTAYLYSASVEAFHKD